MELADVTDSKSVGSNTVWVRVPPPAPNTEAPVGCLCVWLSQTGLEAGETKRSCGAFCPAGERKQSGRAARSASKGRFERRVPPPAPNTEAPVGCLCVWLSQTGLEAGETKRSCGAFCPAGERKQSGRAARSASKGRFERRVPPPAPNTEAPVGCLCVWLSQTGLEAGETKRSCGAFCPAGERKQSGRAARSASKGRFERRVPPPGAARLLSCKLYRSLMWVPVKVRDFDGRGGAAQ